MYSHNNKIMLIDDDCYISNLTRFFFEKEGYNNVDSFTDYIEALNSFRKNKYNIVILGSKTSNLDKLSLYQKFKDIDSNVPICLTNSDIGFQEGIKKHLQKMSTNNITWQSLTLNDNKTKLDFFLVDNKDIILMNP